MRLKDRTAFITGASRGIGKAIALAFAAEGASLGLAGRSMDLLSGLAAEVTAEGGRAVAIELDVSSQESVDDAVNACSGELGPIDILVNNAGIAKSAKVMKMDDEHWESHLAVNLTGTFRVTRAFLPMLLRKNGARVVNIASIAGKVGVQYTAAYCASKHGVVGFTRALALELASEGATVNAICPGFVNTDMAAAAASNIAAKTGGTERDATAWLKSQSPQNRLIEPEEIAAVAVMLASDEARGINGQAINIDGGSVFY